jgi:adenine-specific DNA methylase
MSHPPLLIESWLPIEAIGAESKRERGASSALPPLYFLHVWWARKPLTASRAAILAGVLPQWSPDWPAHLQARFPDEETYHQWFVHLVGIRGDPVKGRQVVDWAKAKGIKLDFHPYGGAPRAFTVNPAADDLELMVDLIEHTWGTRDLSVLDPFAGGGSIPFEALRYGFTTIANDLNPVSAVILKATLDYPARFGPSLADDIRKWGDIWAQRVKDKLTPYFPKQPGESIFAYLWARTVACPVTGKPVPLSPNWWLRKGSDPVAVHLIAESGMDAPRFEIVTGRKVGKVRPDEGTIKSGVGRSPWTGQPIDGDYIKAEAQAGRMGQMQYAVVTKVSGGIEFRGATTQDGEAIRQAEHDLSNKKQGWIGRGIVPSESIGVSNYDRGHRLYGINYWSDFFSPRQLIAASAYLATLGEIFIEYAPSLNSQREIGVALYLAIALDKSVIYNSIASRFNPERGIRSIFDRHNFAFTWNYAEFDAAASLLPWTITQAESAYRGIAALTFPIQQSLFTTRACRPVDHLIVTADSATDLSRVPSDTVTNITVDPPYYDSIQYSELSDFFYVWLKRSVGHLFPEFFDDELTNKDDEAVANPARFEAMGSKKKKLAEQDYERKMAAAFREMHRVLRHDGVLTVMFTHKRVEAWDTLATALISAGFAIKASWPVHTESEHSLHQAKKNAASSTILLVCRKRDDTVTRWQGDKVTDPASPGHLVTQSPVWWEDIQGQVRTVARDKAREYMAQGMRGVDLYISTFGPTLSVISEHWPVLTSEIDPKTGQPKPLRPDTALDLAREEVIRLRKEGLLEGRNVQFDPVTDWYVMAWDAFGAEEFPYDEARKLAIALGLEMDSYVMTTKRIAAKKGQYVVMQQPAQRRKKGMVDPDLLTFSHWIDALHTAMLVYDEDGPGACDVFLLRTGLKRDATFKAVLQTLLNAIPRTQVKGQFVRSEAAVLDNIRLAFYAGELTAPPEVTIQGIEVVQLGMNLENGDEDLSFDEDE